MRFIEHRIKSKRLLRQVMKWLKAGVLEEGKITYSEEGTPQGASLSPLLANIYLHYVFDLWVQVWRKRHSTGNVIVVRFADDIVLGFQYHSDALRFQSALEKRFGKFGLSLHPEKTCLIEFGRFAASNRSKRGEGKPEVFEFLGFTHICSKSRKGRFLVLRKTIKSRMRRKLRDLKHWLRQHLHDPVPDVGNYLRSVLRGHFQYFGVPRNIRALGSFRQAVVCLWYSSLRRRSQKTALYWKRYYRLTKLYLPFPRILHPYPEQRIQVNIRGRSPVR